MNKNQKTPNNSRFVLTWVQERVNGRNNQLEYWQIDSYDNNGWSEATAWDQKVLYWQELPNKPNIKNRKKINESNKTG